MILIIVTLLNWKYTILWHIMYNNLYIRRYFHGYLSIPWLDTYTSCSLLVYTKLYHYDYMYVNGVQLAADDVQYYMDVWMYSCIHYWYCICIYVLRPYTHMYNLDIIIKFVHVSNCQIKHNILLIYIYNAEQVAHNILQWL